jgi:hypothetical protein
MFCSRLISLYLQGTSPWQSEDRVMSRPGEACATCVACRLRSIPLDRCVICWIRENLLSEATNAAALYIPVDQPYCSEGENVMRPLCKKVKDLVTSKLRNPQCTEAAQGPVTSAIIQIVRAPRVGQVCRLTSVIDCCQVKKCDFIAVLESSSGYMNAGLSSWTLLSHNIQHFKYESTPTDLILTPNHW